MVSDQTDVLHGTLDLLILRTIGKADPEASSTGCVALRLLTPSKRGCGMTNGKPERRSADRPVKRVRQLQDRLDVLLRDARALRAEGSVRTRNALEISALLRRKRRVAR
jgi:hypothetical protein